jgi:hypothetical protein
MDCRFEHRANSSVIESDDELGRVGLQVGQQKPDRLLVEGPEFDCLAVEKIVFLSLTRWIAIR